MSAREPMPGELVIDQATGDQYLTVCVSRGTVWAQNLSDPRARGKTVPISLADCEIVDGWAHPSSDEEPPDSWYDQP